jgi:polysaccharide pyruvyl transferase WcaK-like protein
VAREVPFSWRAYQLLRAVDVVVVAGSGQLDEWGGPFGHPYTTFRWALLARLARVPVLYPSVGAGPIDHWLGAFFIRSALKTSPFISVRDRHSGRVLERIGVPAPVPVCTDMGYGYLCQPRAGTRRQEGPAGPGVVGLNVMAHQDPRYLPGGDPSRYQAYLEKMTGFAAWLLDQGYTVRLFSSQVSSDGLAAHDLLAALAERGIVDHPRLQSAVETVETVPELVELIARADVVVACRYHSVLLPLLLETPVLGLAYDPKTSELLADAGLPERCLDIDAFSLEQIESHFRSLWTESPERRAALRARVEEQRSRIDTQFSALFGVSEPVR